MRFAAAVAFACVLLAGCRTTQPGAAMPNRADPIAAAAQQSRAEALGLGGGPAYAAAPDGAAASARLNSTRDF